MVSSGVLPSPPASLSYLLSFLIMTKPSFRIPRLPGLMTCWVLTSPCYLTTCPILVTCWPLCPMRSRTRLLMRCPLRHLTCSCCFFLFFGARVLCSALLPSVQFLLLSLGCHICAFVIACPLLSLGRVPPLVSCLQVAVFVVRCLYLRVCLA